MKGSIVRGLWVLLCAGLVGVVLPGRAATVEYIHTDALGSPVAVTNSVGVVIERREYEPYGKQTQPALANGPGYTGHVSDAVTGLDYMQQRYYDPGIGRFLSVDPVAANSNTGAGFNRYAYAVNNPYRFTDPDGRCETPTGTHICQRGLASSVGPIDSGGGSHRPLNFTTKPGVKLSPETYTKVSNTADNFNDKTGKGLVVTDGMRTSKDQADRMEYKIMHGAGLKEYANKSAANEIMGSYREAIANGADPANAMSSTIQKQMDSGVYVSRHLSGTGADFRNRDLSGQERSILRSSAFDAGATNVLMEGIPPHTHVEY